MPTTFLAYFYWVVSLAACILLLLKTDEYDGRVLQIVFAPFFICKAVMGSMWYAFIPLFLITIGFLAAVSGFPPATVGVIAVILVIWVIIWSISLAKAFLDKPLLIVICSIAFIVFPGPTWIILAFLGGEYQGPVDLFWFMR